MTVIPASSAPLTAAPDERLTERALLRVHPDRGVPDEAAAILAVGLVAHVGFVVEGQPYVIPMSYHFDRTRPDLLYLHGGHHSRLMRVLGSGAAVCAEVTIVDGLVYSRAALHHSVNYRSVVLFGRAADVRPAPVARSVLEAMIARYHTGRAAGRDYDPIPDLHIEATALVAIRIEEWSAKTRRGGPTGPRDGDPTAPGTAGVSTPTLVG